MTITAVLDLRINPEAVADVPRVFHEVLAGTRSFDGCRSVEMLVDQDDPTHMLLVEEWESAEHNERYRAWRATEAPSEMVQMLAGRPQLTWFARTDI